MGAEPRGRAKRGLVGAFGADCPPPKAAGRGSAFNICSCFWFCMNSRSAEAILLLKIPIDLSTISVYNTRLENYEQGKEETL